MKFDFISQDKANHRLMIIFAGWSTDNNFYADITLTGWDVAVIWDYSSTAAPRLLQEILSDKRYTTTYLLCWSLGVAAAEYLAASGSLPIERVTAAFAVNGTSCPASDNYGIPTAIFQGTKENLNYDNLRRFRRRMAKAGDLWTKVPPLSPDLVNNDAAIESLKTELDNLQSMQLSATLPWVKAYISDNDLIFPATAQLRFWSNYDVTVIHLPAGHYIPLGDIAREITPDFEKIGQGFARATTYDDSATAQTTVAKRLADMLPDNFKPASKVLEVGCGTGLFSRMLASKLSPHSITYIDLYKTTDFHLAPIEEYIVDDAETWMMSQPDCSFDAILSANTMQWFANPARFIHNAARMIRAGGFFAGSIYTSGNLAELDALRPCPLNYMTTQRVKEILSLYFDDIILEEDNLQMQFESRRNLLQHLRKTGVSGGNIRLLHPVTLLPDKPTLTYRSARFVCRSPR